MILAKPVVDNQYWILKQDDQKVGNIEAAGDGYRITMLNKTATYQTIPMLSRRENINFEKPTKAKKQPANLVHGFEVSGRAHNAVWDVKHRLPLFTKDNKSKSWFAAGWYRVKQHRTWKVIQNPKLITLQRYTYVGPFHSREEANDKSVS
jgi:hypothetical protein